MSGTPAVHGAPMVKGTHRLVQPRCTESLAHLIPHLRENPLTLPPIIMTASER